MPIVSIPIERLMFGHDYWRSNRAFREIEVYCDLLAILEQRIIGLKNRGGEEEATLRNVEAVNSSYALEIGMKSLWALDNPDGVVKELGHDLAKLYDGLKTDTVEALKQLGLTKQDLGTFSKPFESNRYSMEKGGKDIAVYDAGFLWQLAQLLKDKLDQSRKELISPAKVRCTDGTVRDAAA